MHICEQMVNNVKYLEDQGFTQEQLSSLHHFSLKGRDVSFNLVKDYFGINKNLRDRNADFGNRIIFVAHNHKQDENNFSVLIKQAIEKWPLI